MFNTFATGILVSALGICSLGSAAKADDVFVPRLVTAPIDRVFVPLGFDSNDNVEVVLHGHFPNTCYKLGPALYTVDEATKTIEIDASSYQYNGGCAQMLVPFIQSVSVGLLNQGSYTITVKNRPDARTATLPVTEAVTSQPDDYLYAPVATVGLVSTLGIKKGIRVEGEFPMLFDGCMVLKEVKLSVTPDDVIIVLPIAEIVYGQVCNQASYTRKFSAVTELPGELLVTEYLIHVRVISGEALNKFVVVEN
jgi:hypothetical protein